VVVVPASVVADGVALLSGDLIEVLKDLLDRPVGPLGTRQRAVGVGDIRLVVLVVMTGGGSSKAIWGSLVVRVVVLAVGHVLTDRRLRTYASAREPASGVPEGPGREIPRSLASGLVAEETVGRSLADPVARQVP
jgi:hypothetical protein